MGTWGSVLWRDDTRRIRSRWMTRFSPSGATLIADCEGGIAFWDTARGEIRRFVEAEHLRAFSVTGHRVFAGQGATLPRLLRALHEIPALRRLAFITSHPNFLGPDLVAAIAELPKVARYLHLPAQCLD